MRTGLVILLSLWLISLSLGAHAQSDAPARHVLAKVKLTPEQIDRLIDQIAATQPEPKKGSREFLPGEDQIWNAVDALHGVGVQGFGQLIAHFDDKRFGCCEDSLSSDDVYHLSVGDVCRRIVDCQVTVYEPWNVRDPRGTPGYGRRIVPHSKEEAEAWWKTNGHKELWELQVENLRSVVADNREREKTETDPKNRKLCEAAIHANEELISKLEERHVAREMRPFRPYFGR